jgi:SnoaL-like domain
MGVAWLDRYVEAWAAHPRAGKSGGRWLDDLLECLTTDVRYEDVPTATMFVGHDGIRQMCEAADRWSPDLEITVVTRQTDGSMFALETRMTGTTGQPAEGSPSHRFELRGVSVGTASEGGLVGEHRDYWDLGSFLAQAGGDRPSAGPSG